MVSPRFSALATPKVKEWRFARIQIAPHAGPGAMLYRVLVAVHCYSVKLDRLSSLLGRNVTSPIRALTDGWCHFGTRGIVLP